MGSLNGVKNQMSQLGFNVIVNGDGFTNETFFIPAGSVTYSNLYFDFKNDPRAKRTDLTGFTNDNNFFINIAVPIHKAAGNYTFVEDSIPPYMGFQLTCKSRSSETPASYTPGRVSINISNYGKVGEFIEGNFSGMLHNGDRKISVNGTFKVKRLKDKI